MERCTGKTRCKCSFYPLVGPIFYNISRQHKHHGQHISTKGNTKHARFSCTQRLRWVTNWQMFISWLRWRCGISTSRVVSLSDCSWSRVLGRMFVIRATEHNTNPHCTLGDNSRRSRLEHQRINTEMSSLTETINTKAVLGRHGTRCKHHKGWEGRTKPPVSPPDCLIIFNGTRCLTPLQTQDVNNCDVLGLQWSQDIVVCVTSDSWMK